MSASFLELFIDLAICLNAAARKKQMMCTTRKSFSSTDLCDVNAIPTKESNKSFPKSKIMIHVTDEDNILIS